MSQMKFPQYRDWNALSEVDRFRRGCELVIEAHERAYEGREQLSSNEMQALSYLEAALEALGYGMEVSTRFGFVRKDPHVVDLAST